MANSMQRYMNTVVEWIENWGMEVSQMKSNIQIFTRSRNVGCNIRIKNYTVPIKREQRILGIIFDAPHLTWKPHIEYLCQDIRKRIDIMKVRKSNN